MCRIPVVCVVSSFLAIFCAQAQQLNDAGKLPVKRVVLYKNGVGYFEHLGSVRGSQDVTIPFTSGQLNDVLKTLTVLDLDGGRIAGVAYDSTAPVDRQLGDLHLPYSENATLSEFLASLRGARLEVRSGTSVITGRLLSVERKTRVSGGTTLEVDYISLVTDAGEIKTTEVSPSFSVRLLDREISGKLGRFLDVVSAGRQADVRHMVVSTQGTGDRSLFVSYISEVPVWKATYRIVLDAKKRGGCLLQGWAIVDNVSGQDWDKVTLSLVAGAPQSFIQNLSQPFYARRPVVPLPESTNLTPQTFEATLVPGDARLSGVVRDPTGAVVANATVKVFANGALAGQTNTNAAGQYEFQSLPEGAVMLQVEGQVFQRSVVNGIIASNRNAARQDVTLNVGVMAQNMAVSGASSFVRTDSTSTRKWLNETVSVLGSGAMLGKPTTRNDIASGSGGGIGGAAFSVDAVRVRSGVAATAQELGDLFEYQLKEPITIQKDRSALVPIVQSSINAEKVSVWNEQNGLRRPERALWLTNTSGLTLDGGSFSVLEDETFAGEGIFDPIRPGEKRLVSYATDLALNASSKLDSDRQQVSRILIRQGVMTQTREIRERKTYTVRNEDTSPRTVIVEHPVRKGYELRGDIRPTETTAAWMRFRMPVEPKQTATLPVEEVRPVDATYQISSITPDQLALFVREKSIDATIEAALQRIAAQKNVISELDSKKDECDEQMSKIFDDQQRLRENIKALKGSAEEKALLQRYTQQLNEQETRLETLRKQSEQLEAQKDSAQTALDKTIQDLSFDIKM